MSCHKCCTENPHSTTIDLSHVSHLQDDLLGCFKQPSQGVVQFGGFLAVDEPSTATNNGDVRVRDDL